MLNNTPPATPPATPLLQHLHLHVRNRAASVDFYTHWFGFRTVKTKPDQTQLRDANQFLLVLMDDPAPAPLPAWFHIGFALPAPADVAALHAQMQAKQVPLPQALFQDAVITVFRCTDPDGYLLEPFCLAHSS